MNYSGLWIGAVVLLATASPAHAAEPQVAFVVKGGWVEFGLTRDGKPVADAQVLVFDGQGGKLAEGESGPEGRGEFPLPTGNPFRVEIKVGNRNADPIRLTKVDDRVVPANVLLSFGLAPCCRVPSRGWGVSSEQKPDATADPTPSWLLAAGVAGLAFFVSSIIVIFLPAPGSVIQSTNRESHERAS